MSSEPDVVSAYDIFADGTAQSCAVLGTTPVVGASYRWIHFDLTTPGLADWCYAHLPPLASRTLLAKRTRPSVDVHDDGLVLTLRGVNLNAGQEVEDMVSLRVWATETLVITVRKQRIFALDDVKDQILKGDAPDTPLRLIARITERLVDRIETLSLELEDRAETMEDAGYDTDTDPPKDLLPIRQQVITLRRHIGPLADALQDLAHIDSHLIKKPFRSRLRHTASRAKRSVDEVHEVADRLTALSDHLELQQDARLARNSYKLSVVAAIFLPLSFLTGLFGVNVAGMPGVQSDNAFVILCVSMVVLGVLLYGILRLLKWF